jgi:dTDP-4-amino-4,6-dideoxygalactose transaminase
VRFVPSLPTLDPRLLVGEPRPRRFPFDSTRAQLFYLARAGVYHAMRQFAGGTVLMPAYHHGVEVEAVRAAGARVAFYRVDGEMRVDVEDLERRARAPGVRVVYLTHFVGFAQPAAQAEALCARLGLMLFEDCALALGAASPDGRPLGSFGAASVFCLYKSLPVPHGGLLLHPATEAPTASPPLGATLQHAASLALSHAELRAGPVGRTVRAAARRARELGGVVSRAPTGTSHLRPVELHLGASRLVSRLAPRIDLDDMVRRRRHNFRRLVELLDGCVRVIGAELPAGACPLFVPAVVADKPAAWAALQARRIDAVDFWSGGDPACDPDEFPEAYALRRHVLELPCHQSLDEPELAWVARTVKDTLTHA